MTLIESIYDTAFRKIMCYEKTENINLFTAIFVWYPQLVLNYWTTFMSMDIHLLEELVSAENFASN